MILASRLRLVLLGGLFAAAGAAAIAVGAACSTTTTTTTFTPITGIEIRSAALVSGFGCGTEDSQVFRYAATVGFAAAADAGALVRPPSGPPLFTNIFDCFADGVFENLPTSDAGSLTFSVAIFAYNENAYDAAGLPGNLGCAPTPDGGALQCVPSTLPLTADQERDATWTTLCTATQQSGTPVIAVCAPLQSTRAATGPDAAVDAAMDGTAPAADGAADAAEDASPTPDGATDGGVSPDADASPDDGSATDGSLTDGSATSDG